MALDIKKTFEYLQKVAVIHQKYNKVQYKEFEKKYDAAKTKQELYEIVDAEYIKALKI